MSKRTPKPSPFQLPLDGFSRVCSQCGMYKPFEAFYPRKGYRYGYTSICKQCLLALTKKYQKEHPEWSKEQCRKGYQKHIQQRRESARLRAPKYKAGKPERDRHYRQSNLEKYRERDKIYHGRRRARILNLPDTFTADQWNKCLTYWFHACAICKTSRNIHADHWIPVSNFEHCPGTVAINIVPLCRSCNTSKKATDPLQWLIGKYGIEQGEEKFRQVQAYFDSIVHR